MSLRRHIIWVILVLSMGNSSAQVLEDWLKLGDESLADNDPYGALLYFEKAMELDSAKGLVNYKYAEALRLNHNYSKAAYYYYKVYRKERAKVYPMSGIHLATMQKQSGQFSEAKETWRRVRDQFKNDVQGYWHRKAEQEMRACDMAEAWMRDTATTTLEELPAVINTGNSEFAGHFLNDGTFLFSALRGEFDQKGKLTSDPASYRPTLYAADSTFSIVSPFETEVDSAHWHYFLQSSDSMWSVYVSENDGKNRIHLVNEESQILIRTIPEENDTAWYSHPAFGKIDGAPVLFFSSNKPGGAGQRDIWYTALDPNSEYINAGSEINSPGNEITPFYRIDQEALYFASDWHYGFGGFDIFKSDVNGTSFDFPKNIMRDANSPANDLYYHFNSALRKGSISSNRQGTSDQFADCCNDLWYFEEHPEEPTGPVIENLEDLNNYLPVVLYFHNDEPNPRSLDKSTDKDYMETYRAYTAMLPDYRERYRKGLNKNKGNQAENDMDAFFIESVDQGVSNLDLFASLLLTELEKGSQIEITVKGFASPLAATQYNVNLTERRISSLENYLMRYQRGAVLPYILGTAENSGRIYFNKIPFGEYVAKEYVSDNPNESDAIYSIHAAQERKIEITSVQRANQAGTDLDLRFDREIVDLGTVKSGEEIDFSFDFQKAEKTVIDSVESTNKNVTLVLMDSRVKGRITIDNSPGKHNIIIEVYGNFAEGRKELHLTYEL